MKPASTPEPPYYAVIFTSVLTDNASGYEKMADRMVELSSQMDGFLGLDSARSEVGITVCYWRDLESIENWKNHLEHQQAQKMGMDNWYAHYELRIAKVEKAYNMKTRKE